MTRHTIYQSLAAAMFMLLASQSPAAIPAKPAHLPAQVSLRPSPQAGLNRDYGKLPLNFEPNVGQADAHVRFLTRGPGMTTFFTDTETVMVLGGSRRTSTSAQPGESKQAVVRMRLEGTAARQQTVGLEKLPGVSNYLIGNIPVDWRTDVPHFGRIQYQDVYPGISLTWYGNQQQLEYDFIVAPGADSSQIQVAYEGAQSLRVAPEGDLVLRTALGEVRQQRPRVYQEVDGKQVEVAARYSLTAHNRVTFALARYDRTRQLRIDPVVLVYSTYLGGSGDVGNGIAVDSSGNAYLTGYTTSTAFPTQSAFQSTLHGSYNAYVTKLNPSGNALVYSTFLGGSGIDYGNAIAVDASGSAYIAGYTSSTDFPTQSAYQTSLKGPENAFVAKLTAAGNALAYSTYLGGTGGDYASGIAVDASGSAYVTGYASSTNFPTQSPYQATLNGTFDAFVTKLTAAGNALSYSTYLGGVGNNAGSAIAVDSSGSAYVTGYTQSSSFPTLSPYQATLRGTSNAFVTKLAAAGSTLVYSTYLGGSGADSGAAIAVDGSGSAYVVGTTASSNFPTQTPFQAALLGTKNAFVTKLTAAGNALAYSTYLGGSGQESGGGVAVDSTGAAYVTGSTSSTNFPILAPFQAVLRGNFNAFVTKFAPAGNSLTYSTYIGANGDDSGLGLAIDSANSAYVTGFTDSADFPTLSPYQPALQGLNAAFVLKFAGLSASPSLNISKTHGAVFTLGQTGATYTVTVTNATGAATSGVVTVTETIPAGLTLVSMAGTGWNCPSGGTTCTRTDVLNTGASYPPITVTVNVASNAATEVTNQVSVTGGGFGTTSASDATIVAAAPSCTFSLSSSGSVVNPAGSTGTVSVNTAAGCTWTASSNAYWLTVTGGASGSGSGTVTYAAIANTGAMHTGTLTIANQVFTITQAANSATQIPSVTSISPYQGQGPNATFTLVYSHPNGWAAIQSAEFIINPNWEAGSARASGCYVKYTPATGLFTLIADDGSSVAGMIAPGAAGTINNSQCTLNASASSVTGNGPTLTEVVSLTFQPSFSGQRHIWMEASDYNNFSTNWLVYGVWFPVTQTMVAEPWWQIYDPFTKNWLYSGDPNEYATLGAEGFTQQGELGQVMNVPGTVGGISNITWYRAYVNSTASHFWTSDRNEFLTIINEQQAYVGEGVAAFVMPYINAQGQVSPQVTNTVPFWRAAFTGANLHYWTVATTPFNASTGLGEWPAGYVEEGIACYIFPTGTAQFNSETPAPSADALPAAEKDDGSPAIVSISNGASYVRSGVIAPGQVLNIHGRHLGGTVLLNGVAAQIVSSKDNEIKVVAPRNLAGVSEVSVSVENQGRRTKPVTLTVVQSDPAIFGSNVFGKGNAQAMNEDGTTNGTEHAAVRGSIVTLLTTGYTAGDQPIEAHIGGFPAELISAHVSATRPGVIEVQVRVPDMLQPAAFQPVVLHVGNTFSQPGVGLAIQ